MLKGHLPSGIYDQVDHYTKKRAVEAVSAFHIDASLNTARLPRGSSQTACPIYTEILKENNYFAGM